MDQQNTTQGASSLNKAGPRNPYSDLLPTNDVLNAAQPYIEGPQRAVFSFGYEHSAHCEDRRDGKAIEYSALGRYNIGVHAAHANPGYYLRIDGSRRHIAEQPVDTTLEQMRFIRPRIQETQQTSATPYDQRALCYIAAFVGARAAYGGVCAIPDSMTAITGHSEIATSLTGNQMVTSSGVYNSPDELLTFLHLTHMAGVTRIYSLNDNIMRSGRLLTGDYLSAYCARLVTSILMSANAYDCAQFHMAAAMRGTCAALELMGHSDEGGFCRAFYKCASYPPSCGTLINSRTAIFFGDVCTVKTVRGTGRRFFTSLLFGLAGLTAACDYDASDCNRPYTLFAGDTEWSVSDGRLDQWPGLYEACRTVYGRLTSKICAVYNFTATPQVEVGTLHMFDRYAEEKHLKDLTYANPFFWVEPVALDLGTVESRTRYFTPYGSQRGPGAHTPLMKGTKVMETREYDSNRPMKGSRYLVRCTNTCMREFGISYILNRAYNPADGLRCFELTNVAGADPTMVGTHDGMTHLGGYRWATWDTAIPQPGNGVMLENDFTDIIVTTSNCNIWFNSTNAINKEVTFGCSRVLYPTKLLKGEAKYNERLGAKFVPQHLEKKFQKYEIDWQRHTFCGDLFKPDQFEMAPPPDPRCIPTTNDGPIIAPEKRSEIHLAEPVGYTNLDHADKYIDVKLARPGTTRGFRSTPMHVKSNTTTEAPDTHQPGDVLLMGELSGEGDSFAGTPGEGDTHVVLGDDGRWHFGQMAPFMDGVAFIPHELLAGELDARYHDRQELSRDMTSLLGAEACERLQSLEQVDE